MPRNTSQSSAPNFDNVWLLFQETNKKFLETDKKFLETDKKILETGKSILEIEKILSEKFQATDKKFQETDKKIKELANLFTTQWGKLIEALVEPSCLQLFQDRGIPLEQSFQNIKAKYGKRDMECDILLVNAYILVVIEVKTTFRPDNVTEFADKLDSFKKFFPQYKNYKIMGATAALKYEGQSDKFAYRKGLFVLRSSGEGIIKIVNDKKFEPKIF